MFEIFIKYMYVEKKDIEGFFYIIVNYYGEI